jgi:hypothetical protein
MRGLRTKLCAQSRAGLFAMLSPHLVGIVLELNGLHQ